MNKKDALKNIEPYGMVESAHFEAKSEIELVEKCSTWARAKGYLEALQGEEVKVLIKAHESIISLARSFGDIPMSQATYLCAEESVKALAQYKEVGEKK